MLIDLINYILPSALKSALRSMFEQYGEILDIVAHSNLRMRGQAFVVFKDQESAVKAHMAKQGVTLENKPVVGCFAMAFFIQLKSWLVQV